MSRSTYRARCRWARKTLVARYELGCSPATVRNELSILEETGYVTQPHVSAGRIPTDTGYRSFVDELLERGILLHGARLRPDARCTRRPRSTNSCARPRSLLTRLTSCLAVSVAPSVTTARVKRIDLLSMAPRRALFVLITESGQVVNRSIELAVETAPERLVRGGACAQRRADGQARSRYPAAACRADCRVGGTQMAGPMGSSDGSSMRS